MTRKRMWYGYVRSYRRLAYPAQGVVVTLGTYDKISRQERDVELLLDSGQLARFLEYAKEQE